MEKTEIYRRLQEHMEFTDEEMELFKSDPYKVKMVTETPEFIKCRVVAEVIESQGCHTKHKVGDKFVLTPGGSILTDQCPKEICVHAMTAVGRIIPVISERLVSKSDPNFEMTNIVQCSDIGLDKGGWGKILMKIYVEKVS